MPRRHSPLPLTIQTLCDAMSRIAPPHLAQSWDNVGLLAGDPAAPLRRVLLCIDLTAAVLAEAKRARAGAIVSYHPPIFKPVKSLVRRADDAAPGPGVVFDAVAAGIAVYSPHTALDAADGGTGDALARLCGATIVGPLDHAPQPGSQREVKLVTFVPQAQLERVASAMFAAGGGRIGLYEQCSFRIPGRGTFFGTEGTDPAVGRRGRLEQVDEVRLELVCPTGRLPEIVAAMRAAHPYEEPAFDVYPLAAKPTAIGIGRLARLPKPVALNALAAQLAKACGAAAPQIVGDPKRRVQMLAILAGSAGRVHEDFPRSLSADVLITGEIRHHDARTFEGRGWSAIALGHFASERPVLPLLAESLRRELPAVAAAISAADRDPFRAA